MKFLKQFFLSLHNEENPRDRWAWKLILLNVQIDYSPKYSQNIQKSLRDRGATPYLK